MGSVVTSAGDNQFPIKRLSLMSALIATSTVGLLLSVAYLFFSNSEPNLRVPVIVILLTLLTLAMPVFRLYCMPNKTPACKVPDGQFDKSTIEPGNRNHDVELIEKPSRPEQGALDSTVTPAYLLNAAVGKIDQADKLTDAINDATLDTVDLRAADFDSPTSLTPDSEDEFNQLRRRLGREFAKRKETEKHLQITRKAMCRLEGDLAAETAKRESIESRYGIIRKNLIDTRHELRRSHAARAKALGTANESIAFARQSVEIRAQLESELIKAQQTLSSRHSIMSNLIQTLEEEKGLTQLDIHSLAKKVLGHKIAGQGKRSESISLTDE